jgi:hypothetical protein
MAKLRIVRPRNLGSVSGGARDIYFLYRNLTGSGAHPAHSVIIGAISTRVKRPGPESYHSIPSSAEVNNVWSHTSILVFVFMAWCLISKGRTLTLYILMSWWLDVKKILHFQPYQLRHDPVMSAVSSSKMSSRFLEQSAPEGMKGALFVFCTPVTNRPFSFCRLTDFRLLS